MGSCYKASWNISLTLRVVDWSGKANQSLFEGADKRDAEAGTKSERTEFASIRSLNS